MRIRKIKISELNPAVTLDGLKTIGIDADNQSVSADLTFIKTAADRADQASEDAIQAAENTNNATANAQVATQAANQAALNATDAANTANLAAQNADTQADYAKQQGDYAKNQGDVLEGKIEDTLSTAKGYADTIVAALVGSSPETLDTLQEIADALGNDPNFATTILSEVGKRVTTEVFENRMNALATVARTGDYVDLSNKPTSLPANGGNAATVGGKSIWTGDQAAYDAVAVKDLNTLYFITL